MAASVITRKKLILICLIFIVKIGFNTKDFKKIVYADAFVDFQLTIKEVFFFIFLPYYSS